MYRTLIIVLIFMQLIFAVAAQPPRVTIPGSQLQKISSSIVKGQEYDLHILLPGSFNNSTHKYPVVYLMDSQWDFPLVSALYGEQHYDGFVPEIIVVGITWGGDRPNPDSLRARDYTPSPVSYLPQGGGADRFLAFMNDELFPFIEQNYRGDSSNRTIMGCSLGGLITLYALFTRPNMFKGYVAASPAFGWNGEEIYQYEKRYAESKPNTQARLYITMGGVERGVPGFEKLVSHMRASHYPSLVMQSKVLENTGHSGTKGEGFSRGLQYMFERPSLKLPASTLQKYTGSYRAADGRTLQAKLEGEGLAIYFNERNSFNLLAATEKDFYSKAEYLNVSFLVNSEGVQGMELEQFGGKQSLSRVK